MTASPFPTSLVLVGAPFSPDRRVDDIGHALKESFLRLLDFAFEGRLSMGVIKLHHFDSMGDLLRELSGLGTLVGNDPEKVLFILFSQPETAMSLLQRHVNSIESNTRSYAMSGKMLVYGPDQWPMRLATSQRHPGIKSFLLPHERAGGVKGPDLFAALYDTDYEPGDVSGLQDYLRPSSERDTQPPPPPPRRPSQTDLPAITGARRDQPTQSYRTESTPVDLWRSVRDDDDTKTRI